MFILPIRRLNFKMLLFVIFFGAELIITPLCLVFSLPSQELGWEERDVPNFVLTYHYPPMT